MEHISNSLVTVNQNLGLQQQESIPPRTGEEQKFTIALTGKKIKEAPVEDLKQSLRYVMVKIGLRSQNWPTDEEKQILISHISDNFQNHTVEEIKLAFDLAINGKLDIDDANCYENFSCLYFSKIMLAYRKWAGQTHYQIRQEEEKQKMLALFSPKELTDAEYEELFNQVKDDVQGKRIGYELIPEMVYNWLDKKSILRLTVDQKKEYFKKSIEIKFSKYADDLTNDPLNSMKRTVFEMFKQSRNEGVFPLRENESLKVCAKKLAIHDYIISLAIQNEPGE